MTAPHWAYEPVEIVAYDPSWPARAAEESEELARLLAPWVVSPVEHIGSTAIPALAAKPILDLMVTVASFDSVAAMSPVLLAEGWHLVPPELDQRPWRRFFVKVKDDRRTAHLHVVQLGEPRWDEQIRFRDRLRADPALRHQYAALKREAAQRHADDREAYTASKDAFIRSVVEAG